jgi:beta-phosphoglucomutase-like phosphatase (HAD superfamily)
MLGAAGSRKAFSLADSARFLPFPHDVNIIGVICDVDGTLVDTVDLHAKAWKEAFDYFGKNFSFALVRSQIGKGGDQIIRTLLTDEERSAFGDELIDYRSEHWKRNYLSRVRAFQGVRDLFLRMKKDGKSIVLASSAHAEELQHYKDVAGVTDLIDGETSASDVAHSKPAPDIMIAAQKELGFDSAGETIMIGDSPFDAEAAAKVGIETIGLRCGGFPDSELRAAGVREIYDDPIDLLYHYEQSRLYRNGHGSNNDSN